MTIFAPEAFLSRDLRVNIAFVPAKPSIIYSAASWPASAWTV